jgi:hypothetical protein
MRVQASLRPCRPVSAARAASPGEQLVERHRLACEAITVSDGIGLRRAETQPQLFLQIAQRHPAIDRAARGKGDQQRFGPCGVAFGGIGPAVDPGTAAVRAARAPAVRAAPRQSRGRALGEGRGGAGPRRQSAGGSGGRRQMPELARQISQPTSTSPARKASSAVPSTGAADCSAIAAGW